MVRRVRFSVGAVQHWREFADDGTLSRCVEFDTGRPNPVPEELHEGEFAAAMVAYSSAELAGVRARYGDIGAWLYESVRGEPDIAAVPESAEPVTAQEFEHCWKAAVQHRNFTPQESGPLPQGAYVSGRVEALPWGVGLTGLFVDIGIPVQAFVDVEHLPSDHAHWPAVGDSGRFEVVRVVFNWWEDTARLQIRLKPIAPFVRR
ncbi:hypothetical protein [Nocardia inohanensis]|uniref:hypothetical protein n=1 Tax=Nocardia inohanensis TaxID=209246 RepID=UPI000835BBBE|nr:hypothetical protein [Nocardia inohanensis]